MLADGYWRGASTLVAGPSGAGKTLVALHFVFSGADLGEQGIFATFQENPIQLERVVQGFSWSFKEPKVELMFRPPVDLYLDEWVYDLLDLIERTGAQRVAIDSLGDLRAACGDEIRFREYMYSLLQRCARRNVSVIMTQEVPELFGITRLSEFGISHVSDNVVLLQFLRGDSEVKRAITVLKTRGSTHDPRIRQFEITAEGALAWRPVPSGPELAVRHLHATAISGLGSPPSRSSITARSMRDFTLVLSSSRPRGTSDTTASMVSPCSNRSKIRGSM